MCTTYKFENHIEDACVGMGVCGNSVLCTWFCYESKTALKNKFIDKKIFFCYNQSAEF